MLLALLVNGVGSYFALGPLQNKLLPDQAVADGNGIAPEKQADAMAEFLLAGLLASR